MNVFVSFFFLAVFLANAPLAELLVPNPHGKFTLEGRRGAFEGGNNYRSLVLRRDIVDGVMDVFVLCICCL
jgi:hypothetical protein